MKTGPPKLLAVLCVAPVVLIITFGSSLVEYSRETDPSGQYECIKSYRRYLSWLPMPPGSISDKACLVEIKDRTRSLGRVPVEMIQLADVEWEAKGARIKLIAEWDFENRTCFYWSEDGNKKVYVSK